MSLKGGSRKLIEDDKPARDAAAQPEVLVVDAQLPQVPPFVLARLAEEATAAAERVLALIERHPGVLELADARAQLLELQGTGLQAQRVARILGGDFLPARENIALDEAVKSAVANVRTRAARRGCMVTTELHGVKLWLDPAVLDLLLELGLDWATARGRLVQVRVVFATGTLNPVLLFGVRELRASPARAAGATEPEFNDLQWLLFRMVAQGQMLDPQRMLTGDSATLVLRFAAPVEEVDAAGMTLSESPRPVLEPGATAGGCHVVVVEADAGLRLIIRQTLHEAGMRVEAFASPREAEDLSRHFVAEAIVNGGPPDHPDLLALLAVLRQKNPAVRVIQLTDQDYLYIGADGDAEAARVGRASVRQALVQAILLSVGVFAPPTLGTHR